MKKISGLTILRNGINCGYTFVETIKTLEAICDEVIIYEGRSDDGTLEVLNKICSDKCKVISEDWHQGSDGREFARVTNAGLDKCSGDYIFYLQADEVIHECDYQKLTDLIQNNDYNSIQMQFVHLRYHMTHKIANDAYTEAIRVIKNTKDIRSMTDGYSFEGNTSPSIQSYITVYHAGYVFVYNILKKMINHAEQYYVGNSNYQKRSDTAKKLLARMERGESITPDVAHQELEPFYNIVEHGLDLPSLLLPHIGKLKYEIRKAY